MFNQIQQGSSFLFSLIIFVVIQLSTSQELFVRRNGIFQPVRLGDIRRAPEKKPVETNQSFNNLPKAHGMKKKNINPEISRSPPQMQMMMNGLDPLGLFSLPSLHSTSVDPMVLNGIPSLHNLFPMMHNPIGMPTEPKLSSNLIRRKPIIKSTKQFQVNDGMPRAKGLKEEIQRPPVATVHEEMIPPVTLAPFTLHTFPTMPTISLPTISLPTISLPTISMPTFPPFTLPPSFEQLAAGYTKKAKKRRKKIKRKPKMKQEEVETSEKPEKSVPPNYENVKDADLLENPLPKEENNIKK
uniref:Uncharacterized protein n=1 Tax=Acrobeloides nanus TaxID=290746 RepID=A0A914C9B2_9BILA